MIIEVGKYRIIPSKGHRDYGIWEFREVTANKGKDKGKTRTDWVHMGYYASSFDHALMMVYELVLKDGEDTKDIVSAIKAAKDIKRQIIKAIEAAVEK